MWGGAVLLLLVAAALVAARMNGSGTAVDLGTVARTPVFRSFVTASGQIVAQRYADIGASSMGRLTELRVKEGDAVRRGQVLARIDRVQATAGATASAARVTGAEADVRAAIQQLKAAESDVAAAAARAKQAQQTLQRTVDLRRDGLVPAAQLDADKAAADAADAQVAGAKALLERLRSVRDSAERRLAESRADLSRATDVLAKTDIVSPIDGVITRLPVQEGEMVVIGIQNAPGTILMTVSDLGAIDAEVRVAEADVLRVQVGQSATVRLEALPGTTFAGKVVEIGASALPVTGTGAAAREFKVKVRLDSPGRQLRPGLTCDTEILTAERRGVLTVPLQAVVIRPSAENPGRTGVFVPEGRVARFRPVKTGLIGGLDIEVSGLTEGSSLVIGPFQALRDLQDGQSVRPQNSR